MEEWLLDRSVLADQTTSSGWLVGSSLCRQVLGRIGLTSLLDLRVTLPGGVDVVGLYDGSAAGLPESEISTRLSEVAAVFRGPPPILAKPAGEGLKLWAVGVAGALEEVSSFEVRDDLSADWSKNSLNLHFQLPLSWDHETESMERAKSRLESQSAELKRIFSSSEGFLYAPLSKIMISMLPTAADDRVCSALRVGPESDGGGGVKASGGKKGGKKGGGKRGGSKPGRAAAAETSGDGETVVGLKLIVAQRSGHQSGKSKAPMLSFDAQQGAVKALDLTLDLVVSIPAETPLVKLGEAVASCACAQIDAMVGLLTQSMSVAGGVASCARLKVQHFMTPRYPFPVTALFALPPDAIVDSISGGAYDAALLDQRRDIHRRLALPEDRPMFRASNAWDMYKTQNPNRLRNPHTTLAPSGVANGTQYITAGGYDYYHYMQDGIDDNGWGCAYRSFQSIASWFVIQGYEQIKIPTHREIQQMCLDNKMREKSFVGSKEWIGSMEVGWLLQWSFPDLGIENKYIASVLGQDMPTKARELAVHFETNGTPVMVGGNNLAHTILGVDFNSKTGDVEWLILDPHFTGADDLKTILTKGWCGWKGRDFWKSGVTFNMCLPQRPVAI